MLVVEFAYIARPVSEANLNAVRVSTHIFNLESDCDLIVQGITAFEFIVTVLQVPKQLFKK
jgi:hypothetical protein